MEIFRALGALVEPPLPEHRALAEALELGEPPEAALHTDLFLFQLPPLASIYLGSEGMQGGEAADRIAGFWRALGLDPPEEADHLSTLLAAFTEMEVRESDASSDLSQEKWRHARRAYLGEHLLSWLPFYLRKLQEVAPPYYQRWGTLLHEALSHSCAELDPPESLPLHLRSAASVNDPRDHGGESFLRSLLVPLRSGLIIVRSDLERASRDLDLGLRVGERQFALRALLGQNAKRVLDWLATEAQSWRQHHMQELPAGTKVRKFWRDQAAATAALISELAAEA